MQAYHYLLSWLYTIIVGIAFNFLLTNDSETAFGFTVAAGVFSLPFIILFGLLMAVVLQMQPRKQVLHLVTFIIHAFGALLTFLALIATFDDMLPVEFPKLILGYFILDSIFFHVFIELKHKNHEVVEDEILDNKL